MDYVIGFAVLFLFVVLVIISLKHYLPIREFECKIIKKQTDTWRNMSVSNKVTSYELVVQTKNLDTMTILVLSSETYSKLSVGDYGTIKVRGRFFIDFKPLIVQLI